MKKLSPNSAKPSRGNTLHLYEILLPATASRKQHRRWEAHISHLAGGVSILSDQIEGRWKSKTVVIRERQIPIRIACSRIVLGKVLRFTAIHFRQTEVLGYLVSSEVIFFRTARKAGGPSEEEG